MTKSSRHEAIAVDLLRQIRAGRYRCGGAAGTIVRRDKAALKAIFREKPSAYSLAERDALIAAALCRAA